MPKPIYTWDWIDGKHVGISKDRVRVESKSDAVEYARERTCRNLCKQVDKNGETPIYNGIYFICSECDAYVRDAEGYHSGLYPDYSDTEFKYDIEFSYCPNCGAKVVE